MDIDELIFIEHNGEAYRYIVESIERTLLAKAFTYTHGNQLEAARILGINRNTLRTKLKKLGIIRS
ncbi:MAG: hypothetical protein NT099_01875 [Candidatus Saganbacteria bacterium]|nr:hypothetical protein [Candidatus Saganbacteria bacterium]